MTSMDPRAQAFVQRMADALEERPDLGMAELMDQVKDYLHIEALSIFMLDRATNELLCKYAAGPVGQQVFGLRIPVGQGVVGWVVQYEEDLNVPSTDLDPRFYGGVDEQTGFVTRSILCVPMFQAGQIIGAVEAMNKTTGHFNDEDVLLLQEIADIVADYA
jgi:NtrC-family two-component system sensor histidine kinase KinB